MSSFRYPRYEDCPDAGDPAKHTPAPDGYLAWHEWAARMSRAGNKQQPCPTCGFLTLWAGPGLPKERRRD